MKIGIFYQNEKLSNGRQKYRDINENYVEKRIKLQQTNQKERLKLE